MLDVFNNDILPGMQLAGYDGVRQHDKEEANAVATFWKTPRLSLDKSSSRSRTMITTLRDASSSNNLLAIVNCHLEGHPLKAVARVTQLSHALKELSKKYSHHGLVICGDFNCECHSSACGAYLALGSCPAEGVLEWRRSIRKEIASIEPHHYDLVSAYPPELGRSNRFEYYTYSRLPGRPVAGLDQIWHSPASLRCVALRRLYKSDELRRLNLEQGMPNEFHPSDHIPIGCVLQWTGISLGDGGFLVDLKDAKEETVCEIVDDMSCSELMIEAEFLLEACPFQSENHRKEFEYIMSDIPGLPEKGKPSDEQLAQLNDRRERKDKLLTDVSEEVGPILRRILRLHRATKAQTD